MWPWLQGVLNDGFKGGHNKASRIHVDWSQSTAKMPDLPATHRNTNVPGGGVLDSTGVWVRIHTPPETFPENVPALFLDRDGVINQDVHYLAHPDKVKLLEGAAGLIAHANANNHPVIVVSNQSGIGRGYFDWEAFASVQQRISEYLAQEGAHWDMVLACPFHEKARPPYNVERHPGRKPATGMIDTACNQFSIDRERSWIIGDRSGDMECGRRAGFQGGVYAATHEKSIKQEADDALAVATPGFPVTMIRSLQEARPLIPFLKDL